MGERVQWVVTNCGLSVTEAQERVIGEFPAQFSGSAQDWDPSVVCDGSAAEDRVQWLITNKGLSVGEARQRVMDEFPAQFKGVGPHWDPKLICDGSSAEDRARWLIDNKGLSVQEARQQVMEEFPIQFSDLGQHGKGVCLGGASAGSALVPVSPADPALLVWSDEFDYDGPPNPAKWSYDVGGHGWGNNELQYYSDRPTNAWVSDGALRIRAVREACEGMQFTSARLVTKGKADWLYGRVEVRLRLPLPQAGHLGSGLDVTDRCSLWHLAQKWRN